MPFGMVEEILVQLRYLAAVDVLVGHFGQALPVGFRIRRHGFSLLGLRYLSSCAAFSGGLLEHHGHGLSASAAATG